MAALPPCLVSLAVFLAGADGWRIPRDADAAAPGNRSLGVVAQLSGIVCDWDGYRLMSGEKSNDNYNWDCSGGQLRGIYSAGLRADLAQVSTGHEDVAELASGALACDWNGDRSFSGAASCDDFLFSCYSGKLWSITFVGRTGRTSSCSGYGCPADARKNYNSAVSCNWNRPLASHGGNSNDNFYFTCVDGKLTRVQQWGMMALEEPQRPLKLDDAQTAQTGGQTCISWGTARGSWKLVAFANEPYIRRVSWGTESSDTNSLTQEWAISITKSVSAGMLFGSASVSVETSYSIAVTTEHTFTQSYGQEYEFGCPYGGMYQWVMKNGRPWESEAQMGTTLSTQIILCTYGADKPPQCPPTACYCPDPRNCDCQQCKSFEGPHENVSYVPPTCDWSGGRLMSGGNDDDNYMLYCEGWRLTSISAHSRMGVANMAGCTSCDWTGVRHFAGAKSNDNFFFHCCGSSGNLLGVHAIDGFTPSAPGSHSNGIPCQWTGKRRAYGIRSNDDFDFTCSGGLLTVIQALPDR